MLNANSASLGLFVATLVAAPFSDGPKCCVFPLLPAMTFIVVYFAAALVTAAAFCHDIPVALANSPSLRYIGAPLVQADPPNVPVRNANSRVLGLIGAVLVATALLSGPVLNANSPSHGLIGAALVTATFPGGPVSNANSPSPGSIGAALVGAKFPGSPDGPVSGGVGAPLMAADTFRHLGRGGCVERDPMTER